MRNLVTLQCVLALIIPCLCSRAAGVPAIEQWNIFEVALAGPTNGNPFTDVPFSARFTQGESSKEANGFYDGDGIFRVRFMPDKPGEWHYTTESSSAELNGKDGAFTVTKPSPGNHGPVRVTNTFHFAYADGAPFCEIGTTSYNWAQQSNALEEQTLATLAAAPFNKIRFVALPSQPYSNLVEDIAYPFQGAPPHDWDYTRFNPKFFQHLEERVGQLRDLGIQADLILFQPYDKGRLGFDRMEPANDDRYVRYLVARLAAYRNIWWSLANEFDLMREKKDSDWDRLFQVVQDSDPYQRLRSIHNSMLIYNNSLPWVTHASIQNGSAVEDAGRAELYRDVWRKPVVFDEVKYEGDISKRWGNLSGPEMVHRFWEGLVGGTYVGHGEVLQNPSHLLWTSEGGKLYGQSPPRLAFLRKVMEQGPPGGFDPIDKWQYTQICGHAGDYYLVYFGASRPTNWVFELPKPKLTSGLNFKVEVLDTWNMTVTPVDGVFTVKSKTDYTFADVNARAVALPGLPWQALRIEKIPRP